MSRKFAVLCNDKEWRFETKSQQMDWVEMLIKKGWNKKSIRKVTVA